jgi:hypothetical protein
MEDLYKTKSLSAYDEHECFNFNLFPKADL